MDEFTQSPFALKLFSFLLILEKIMLVATMIGLILRFAHLAGADSVLMISITTLAMISFLIAFKNPKKTAGDFQTQLVGILEKVLPIACAVCWIGILFWLLNLVGYDQMLMMGFTSVVVGTVISLFLMARIPGIQKALQGHLIRAVPLGFASLFLLYFAVK